MEKHIAVIGFDGAVMNGVLGKAFAINATTAVNLVADIELRKNALEAKAGERDSLAEKLRGLIDEIQLAEQNIASDEADVRLLLAEFCRYCASGGVELPETVKQFLNE